MSVGRPLPPVAPGVIDIAPLLRRSLPGIKGHFVALLQRSVHVTVAASLPGIKGHFVALCSVIVLGFCMQCNWHPATGTQQPPIELKYEAECLFDFLQPATCNLQPATCEMN